MNTANLFCSVGDIVQIISPITTTPWLGEKPEKIKKGSQYKVVGLTGEGWDLKRLSGDGPLDVRILNSEMANYVIIIKKNI